MEFNSVLGHSHIKKYLNQTIENQRIAHAQLFIGNDGIGVLPMAIAYASQIISNGNATSMQKCINLQHPDLHFSFPVAKNEKFKDSKSSPVSSWFSEEWRSFLKEEPYGTIFDWYKYLGIEKKQGGLINVAEAREISSKLALKSFEGGYKVMIIWRAELMNDECANKLLKLLEEPPAKTIFLLIAQDERQILNTIYSRCQITRFNDLGEKYIIEGLIQRGFSSEIAKSVAHQSQGNFKKALDFAENQSEEKLFEQWFIHWVRTAFRAKGNKAAILPLLKWSEEISASSKEIQKQFLDYCLSIFRQALLVNYGLESLSYTKFSEESQFELRKFAPFIHNNNILHIQKEIENAILHIERNANAKVTFTDLSIRLTRLLHG